MSKNEVSENLISHYLEPKKPKFASLKSLLSAKKKNKTLNNFSVEVKIQKSIYSIDSIYNGKNAREIEIMMMKNRKLIEANHSNH